MSNELRSLAQHWFRLTQPLQKIQLEYTNYKCSHFKLRLQLRYCKLHRILKPSRLTHLRQNYKCQIPITFRDIDHILIDSKERVSSCSGETDMRSKDSHKMWVTNTGVYQTFALCWDIPNKFLTKNFNER